MHTMHSMVGGGGGRDGVSGVVSLDAHTTCISVAVMHFYVYIIALASYWPTETMKQEFRSYCNYYKVKNELNPSTETD